MRGSRLKVKKKKNKGPLIMFIVVTGFIVFTLYHINSTLKPTIMALCDAEARNIANETINNTVREEFSSLVNYEDIMDMKTDKDGNLIMIQADTVALNKIGAKISLEIQERIKGLGNKTAKIPLGAITKNDLFASYGPKISFSMKPLGSIETKYRSEFESKGINQTRHVIYVDITTNMQVVVPLATNNIKVKTNIPIAESIIVGKVPDTYANFNRELQGIGVMNGNTNSN
ncbi:MAG: sporulation protein YunB [Clostridium sp.]